MKLNPRALILCAFCYCPALSISHEPSYCLPVTQTIESENLTQDLIDDSYVEALGSLICHIGELQEQLQGKLESSPIEFLDADVACLWNQANLFFSSPRKLSITCGQQLANFETAYFYYYQAKNLMALDESELAANHLEQSHAMLLKVWSTAIEDDPIDAGFRHLDHLTSNPYIAPQIKEEIKPYVLPTTHRMKLPLDAIFTRKRATRNYATFRDCGFNPVGQQRPRSFVIVAKHRKLKGYLVKAYLDDDPREKRDRPSWKWLVRRCEGSEKIRKIIKDKNIKHFTVAKKWIYPLPAEPSPPNDGKHIRHLALLLVTDMNLAPDSENYYAWSNHITKAHLRELYTIISRARGSSYRPDNISYTKKHKFAFIDTEYPSGGPDYKSIRGHLHPEMRTYWDHLVRKGGK